MASERSMIARTPPGAAALGLAAALALAATSAHAQAKFDSSAPIDITADQLEVMNNQCLLIWSGAAEALQGQARLRADVLKVFSKKLASKPAAADTPAKTDCGDAERLEAHGDVYYVTGERRVRGDDAIYLVPDETITITGDVVATQGQNVLRGRRLVVNTRTGEARMQTPVKGRNKPGRVRGVFYPDKKNPS